jgi:hypothetical protein
MGEETKGGGGWGSDIPVSSRVDPTSVMPAFDQGKPPTSMSVEEAKAEWNAMTIDTEDKYKTFPRDLFLSRRNALWERGFAEDLANQKKTRKEESEKWLEKENDRFEKRDLKETKGRVVNILKPFFDDDEEKAGEAIQDAIKAMDEIGLTKEDKHFLEESGQGNSPLLIMTLAKIKGHPALIDIVRKIGIKDLIKLEVLIPRRGVKK